MASRPPIFTPLRRSEVILSWADRLEADSGLLRRADRHLHALATGYGGPAAFAACEILCTTPGTTVLGSATVRVPPGVTHAHVGLVVTGRGWCRVTSAVLGGASIDTEGSLLSWVPTEIDATLNEADAALTIGTSRVDDAGTDTTRALIVSPGGSPALVWADVSLGLELDAYYGDTLDRSHVLGLYLGWIHGPMTAT